MKPGIYKDLSNKDYHLAKGLNVSKLKTFDISPGLIKWANDCPEYPEKKKVFDIGNAAHTMVLEPLKFNERYAVEPAVNKRTNAGKFIIYDFLAENSNKTILTAAEHRQIDLMSRSVYAHPDARRIIENQVGAEISIFAKDEDGQMMKIRLDMESRINGKRIVLDLKTIDKIENISKAINERGYNIQEAFYREVYKMHHGVYPDFFLFCFIGKAVELGRYPCRIGELCQADKDDGYRKMNALVSEYKSCKASGNWPGIQTFSRYKWAK